MQSTHVLFHDAGSRRWAVAVSTFIDYLRASSNGKAAEMDRDLDGIKQLLVQIQRDSSNEAPSENAASSAPASRKRTTRLNRGMFQEMAWRNGPSSFILTMDHMNPITAR